MWNVKYCRSNLHAVSNLGLQQLTQLIRLQVVFGNFCVKWSRVPNVPFVQHTRQNIGQFCWPNYQNGFSICRGLIEDQGVPQPGQGNPKLLGHDLDPLLLFRGIVDACRLCHVGDRPGKSHILPRLGHVTPAYCCVCFCHLAAKHCLLS